MGQTIRRQGTTIDHMNETLQYPSDPTTAPQPMAMPGSQPFPPPLQAPPHKPSRLNKVAAWVGIVAGSLVIIAVLFGSGFYMGRRTTPRSSWTAARQAPVRATHR